jgi:hypothetical protein
VPFWPRAKLVDGCAWRDSLQSHATIRGATLQLVTPRRMARPLMQSRREIWHDLLVPFWPRAKLVEGCAWRDSLLSHATPRGTTIYSVPPRYSARLSEESRHTHPLTKSAVGILCTNWSRQLKWRDSSMNKHLVKYFYTTTKNRRTAF